MKQISSLVIYENKCCNANKLLVNPNKVNVNFQCRQKELLFQMSQL